MSNKKHNKEKQKQQPLAKEVQKKEKINWEKKFKEVEKLNAELQIKIFQLNIENKKNIEEFQSKAKGFEGKASEKIKEFEDKLRIKYDNEAKLTKKYGAQKFLEAITPILFNIDIAISSGKAQGPEVSAYVMGFEMLLNQIYTAFENNGAHIISPKIGSEYDPEEHEAFSVEDGGAKITQIKRKGIKLHDRVLIPASVVVGK